MSVDLLRAHEIAREVSRLEHDPGCRYRVMAGTGALCTCRVLTHHPEYRAKALFTRGGALVRDCGGLGEMEMTAPARE